MKISAIELYECTLTYSHGTYIMSKGRAAKQQPTNLVRIITDTGLDGWGETALLAGNYLPVFAGGTREALRELAPHLIGQDPRATAKIQNVMNGVLTGQNNAKSAIDIACWDVFGKSVELPISALIGGVLSTDLPIYEAIPLASAEENIAYVKKRSAAGVRRFQIKVGDDPRADAARVRAIIEATDDEIFFFADSNAGWTFLEASIAMRELEDLNIFIEQPCLDVADCAMLRKVSPLPIIMDEGVVTIADLHRAKYEVSASAINLKLGRVGGITPAVTMRNSAQALGMHFCIEDMWGGDIITAAASHVAASAHPGNLLHTAFFNDWTDEHVGGYQPRTVNGRGAAPTSPGLGINIDLSLVGEPVARFS